MSQIWYHDSTLLNIHYIGVPEVFNYFSCLHIHVNDNAFDKTLFKTSLPRFVLCFHIVCRYKTTITEKIKFLILKSAMLFSIS